MRLHLLPLPPSLPPSLPPPKAETLLREAEETVGLTLDAAAYACLMAAYNR